MTQLKASFVLDQNGKPRIYTDTGGKQHYAINLFMADIPTDTIGVTYQLDKTYRDPLRDVSDPSRGFQEEITSYGDYDIVATCKTKPRPTRIRSSLYDALLRTYSGTQDPDIKQALK